jgi:hypothetical protein
VLTVMGGGGISFLYVATWITTQVLATKLLQRTLQMLSV